jgi:MFS family permease
MAPHGLGAALAMPFTGRLTDRIGGGRVAVVGTLVMALATLPLAAVGSGTPYALLAGVLVVRGIGLGGAMMPAMAGAFATLTSAQVPRATSALNALQRVGGSIGTALLAVVLDHQGAPPSKQAAPEASSSSFPWKSAPTSPARSRTRSGTRSCGPSSSR